MAQIVLDAEAFKALSSDTRLQILKALDARRLTVSELGRLLDLNKATVFEHLKQLSTADLVKKEDEGRKWVYYRLTWKGKNVLHPENVQFMLLLGTSIFSIGGLIVQMGRLVSGWNEATETSQSPESAPLAPAQDGEMSDQSGATSPESAETRLNADTAPQEGAVPSTADPDPLTDANLWLVAVLLLLLVAAGIFAWRYLRERRRERLPLLRRIEALPPPEPDYA